jgi:hypothetical protein
VKKMAADRVPQIDIRLNEIGIREQATQNEQLLVLLAQERLAMTNERISLTSPATQPGNYPVAHAGVGFGYIVYIYPKPHPSRYTR